MAVVTLLATISTRGRGVGGSSNPAVPTSAIEVGLLTGGGDKPYAFGLATALVSKGACLDFIGSDELDSPDLHASAHLRFINLRGDQRQDANITVKVWRVLLYYMRLIRYALVAKPKMFHILWNNKFQIFDRTLLMLYYKALGKKIAFTAHNVNAGKRDSNDSLLNRVSLRIQYLLADHIFVHTQNMKDELVSDFGISQKAVSVIPFGINNAVPHTDLTSAEAKQRLGIKAGERTILFFGNIAPYKGLEYLVDAYQRLSVKNGAYRLIIAGRVRAGDQPYWSHVQRTVSGGTSSDRVIQKIEFIPDQETELYFKAADVLVLPYTQVSQSGVLFLGYSFGLPAIATDVGSIKEDIMDGRTGLLARPCDPVNLADCIETYFESDLFKELDRRRQEIQCYANARHSWDIVGDITLQVYGKLLATSLPAEAPQEAQNLSP